MKIIKRWHGKISKEEIRKKLWKNAETDHNDLNKKGAVKKSHQTENTTMNEEVKIGQFYKIDMDAVKKHDSMPPYLNLVRDVIRKSLWKGKSYINDIKGNMVEIGSSRNDILFLGGVWVPVDAVVANSSLTENEVGTI